MISIVVPVYNEEENIRRLYDEIVKACRSIQKEWELLLIDDGSRDGTVREIRRISELDNRVRGLLFSRNFGQYCSVTAGVHEARGEAIIIMDADLQEPPSLIPKLIEKWELGFKAVYTSAIRRKDSFLRSFLASIFYRIFGNTAYLKTARNISEMRLIGPEIIAEFKKLKEVPRFIKGSFFWFGYDYAIVEYEKQKRVAGESKYPLRRLVRLALDGIFSFSFLPIQLITHIGTFLFFVGILYAIAGFFTYLFSSTILIFNPYIFLAIFLGGIQLLSLGIIGEYIGRIYDEVRGRPRYIIQERIGFESGRKK